MTLPAECTQSVSIHEYNRPFGSIDLVNEYEDLAEPRSGLRA
jgi:hypothetical protein